MKSMQNGAVRWFLPLVVIILLSAWTVGRQVVQMASGFYAKNLCSGVFVALRDPIDVVRRDLLVYGPKPVFNAMQYEVNREAAWVTAGITGLGQSFAAFVPGQGCVRMDPQSEVAKQMRTRQAVAPTAAVVQSAQPWPQGDTLSGQWETHATGATFHESLSAVQRQALAQAFEAALVQREADGSPKTRAILVVHKGQVVAERYVDQQPLVRRGGWSMAKTALAVAHGSQFAQLSGAELQKNLDSPLQSAKGLWPQGDARNAITLRQWLNMSSGVNFNESYGNPWSDVNQMLFVKPAVQPGILAQAVSEPAESKFSYSSGTTNTLSLALRQQLGEDAYKTVFQKLFSRLNMNSAVIEADSEGVWVGSSFLYATARDWAKLGLMLLRNGEWFGEQIVSADWVRFMATPAASTPNYGGHVWISEPDQPASLPAGSFAATGHGGQRVTIVPSKDLVVVRMGLTLGGGMNHPQLVRDVIQALSQ